MCSGVVFCQFVNLWDHNFAVKAHIHLSFRWLFFCVFRYPHDIHSSIAVLVHIYDANSFLGHINHVPGSQAYM